MCVGVGLYNVESLLPTRMHSWSIQGNALQDDGGVLGGGKEERLASGYGTYEHRLCSLRLRVCMVWFGGCLSEIHVHFRRTNSCLRLDDVVSCFRPKASASAPSLSCTTAHPSSHMPIPSYASLPNISTFEPRPPHGVSEDQRISTTDSV